MTRAKNGKTKVKTANQPWIVLIGIGVGLTVWVVLEMIIHGRFAIQPGPASAWAMELALFGIIIGAVALTEIIRLVRLFATKDKGADSVHLLQVVIALLIAFAGSLAIYVLYVWIEKALPR